MQGTTLSRTFSALGRAIVRAPLAFVLGVLVLTGVMGYFATQAKVNNAQDIFFVQGDPTLTEYQQFQDDFGSDHFVMVFLEGDNLFSPAGHKTVTSIVDAMEALKYEEDTVFGAVLSPFTAPVMRESGGEVRIAPVIPEGEEATPARLADAKASITTHPLYKNLIVNEDGTVLTIVGTVGPKRSDDAFFESIARQMQELVKREDIAAYDPLLVGGPVFREELNSATASESAIFGSAAIGVAILAMLLLFRKKRQVLAAIGVVIIAVVWTVGLMALTDTEMSLVSIILPLAIIITGLGSGVHIINEFRAIRRAGATRHDAVIRALSETGTACMLTALTTGVGFFSMVSAPVQPMKDLGIFAALGVVFSFILAVTLVPAMLSFGDNAPLPDAEPPPSGDDLLAAYGNNDKLFTGLARRVVANALGTTLIFTVGAIVLTAGFTQLQVESKFLQAFRESHPFRQAVERVDARLSGSDSLEVIIDTGVDRGVFDPTFLKQVDALGAWVREKQGDKVGATLSITDLFREVNGAFSGTRALPTTRAAAAQLMLLYESGGGETGLVMDTNGRKARLSVRVRSMTTGESIALEDAIRAHAKTVFTTPVTTSTPVVQAAPTPVEPEDDEDTLVIVEDDTEDEAAPASAPAPAPRAVAATTTAKGPPTVAVTGAGQLFVHLAAYVVDSQVRSFGLAALIIAFLMMFMLRSAKLGLAVMIPNILPIFATYGIMGWVGISLDWLTACIAVGALGVAVDGTIHIGSRYRYARGKGYVAAEAAQYVMVSIGRALVVTSTVLSAGFLVVIPSRMASLARFGGLMALCLFLALLADLIMTPAVLAWLNPGGDKKDAD